MGEYHTCGIRSRYSLTNVHVARSVLDSCTMKGDKIATLQINLAKAFDRVRHPVFLTL